MVLWQPKPTVDLSEGLLGVLISWPQCLELTFMENLPLARPWTKTFM